MLLKRNFGFLVVLPEKNEVLSRAEFYKVVKGATHPRYTVFLVGNTPMLLPRCNVSLRQLRLLLATCIQLRVELTRSQGLICSEIRLVRSLIVVYSSVCV